ncbi:HEPN domain-containing protein, partial [Thermus sp.]
MERSRDFFLQAGRDLEQARLSLREGFYEWAAFAAQQGAEKAVKAVFQRLGAVAWGHSVARLLEELAQTFPVPEALLDGASELDKAYIP